MREYNIYQINCFLFDVKTFTISCEDIAYPLKLHMYYDGRLMFGLSSEHPLFPYIKEGKRICILAYREDGHFFRYTGVPHIEENPHYALLMQRRCPRLTRYINAITHFKLYMFHLEEAEALMFDEFHNSTKVML
jgi:uncharacterized pyridoxamine 5'-phosphate oxidase family protein